MEIILVFAIGITIGYLLARGNGAKEEDSAIQAWKDAAQTMRDLTDRQSQYIDWLEGELGFPPWEQVKGTDATAREDG